MTSDPSVHRVSNSDPSKLLPRKNFNDTAQSAEFAFFDELLNISFFDSAVNIDVAPPSDAAPSQDVHAENDTDSVDASTESESDESLSETNSKDNSLDLIGLIPFHTIAAAESQQTPVRREAESKLKKFNALENKTDTTESIDPNLAFTEAGLDIEAISIPKDQAPFASVASQVNPKRGAQDQDIPIANARSPIAKTSTDSKIISTKRIAKTEKSRSSSADADMAAASGQKSFEPVRLSKRDHLGKHVESDEQQKINDGTDTEASTSKDAGKARRNMRSPNKDRMEIDSESTESEEAPNSSNIAIPTLFDDLADRSNIAIREECWYAAPPSNTDGTLQGTSLDDSSLSSTTSTITGSQGTTVSISTLAAQTASSVGTVSTTASSPHVTTPEAIGATQHTQSPIGDRTETHSDSPRGAVRSAISPYQQSKLVHRVLRGLEQLGDGGGQVKLRLHPPELGSLQMTLRIESGQMYAHLEVENALARDALLTNVQSLRDRLSEQGMQIETFDVQIASDASSSNSSDAGHTRHGFGSEPNWNGARSRFAETNSNRIEPQIVERERESSPLWVRKLGSLDLTV